MPFLRYVSELGSKHSNRFPSLTKPKKHFMPMKKGSGYGQVSAHFWYKIKKSLTPFFMWRSKYDCKKPLNELSRVPREINFLRITFLNAHTLKNLLCLEEISVSVLYFFFFTKAIDRRREIT